MANVNNSMLPFLSAIMPHLFEGRHDIWHKNTQHFDNEDEKYHHLDISA